MIEDSVYLFSILSPSAHDYYRPSDTRATITDKWTSEVRLEFPPLKSDKMCGTYIRSYTPISGFTSLGGPTTTAPQASGGLI